MLLVMVVLVVEPGRKIFTKWQHQEDKNKRRLKEDNKDEFSR